MHLFLMNPVEEVPRHRLKGSEVKVRVGRVIPTHGAVLLTSSKNIYENLQERNVTNPIAVGTEAHTNSEGSLNLLEQKYRLNYTAFRLLRKQPPPLRWVKWNNVTCNHDFLYNEDLQLRVIKRLGEFLPAVKSFRSNDFEHLSDGPNQTPIRIPKKMEYPETQISIDLATVNSRQLWHLYTHEKMRSIAMQRFILEADDLTLEVVSKLTVPLIPDLIINNLGNYCLQKIISRDEAFRSLIEKYCLENLKTLVYNEYSSRTMQSLVENSDFFRKWFLNFAAGDTKGISKRISYVFLVTSAIGCAKSEDEVLPLVADVLKSRDRWFGKKYMKRIVVSLIQKCSLCVLNILAEMFYDGAQFHEHFNDRYKVYIVVAFIKREHQQTITSFRASMKTHLEFMIEASYFKLFADIIFRSRLGSISRLIHDSLENSELYFSGNWRSKTFPYRFAYFLALTATAEQFSFLSSLWQELCVL